MNPFKKASQIEEKTKGISHPPGIKDAILQYLNNSGQYVTVTGTIIELNKKGLNPSRNTVKNHLDRLVKSGFCSTKKSGNVCEYKKISR